MRPDTLSSHQQRILDAQVYLEGHLDRHVSVSALARRGNYSTFHFLHVFRALVGEAPGEYPRRLRIERIAALRVAFIRYRGPYAEVPLVFDRLREWAAPLQPLFIGLAHDNPGLTPPGQVRFDCAVVVDAAVRGAGDIDIQEVPAGVYAAATHRGAFQDLGRT